jgi:hypothetical protein
MVKIDIAYVDRVGQFKHKIYWTPPAEGYATPEAVKNIFWWRVDKTFAEVVNKNE